jgi:hypothetical protein
MSEARHDGGPWRLLGATSYHLRMADRPVTSPLLLVGSPPADSTEAAFRAGGDLFADLVFALPGGETGSRAAWVGFEREWLVRPNPGVERVAETESLPGRDGRETMREHRETVLAVACQPGNGKA